MKKEKAKRNSIYYSKLKEVLRKVYDNTEDELLNDLNDVIENNEQRLVVTANPEILVKAKEDVDLFHLLLDQKTIITADGIGVVKMADKISVDIPHRITGVSLSTKLLSLANAKNYSVALYGASPEVSSAMKDLCKTEYPNAELLLVEDGYTRDKDEVMQEIATLQPNIILVALGVPLQEQLLYSILPELKSSVCVGVGGSFDVISGHKERAPKIFQRLGMEWLYRLLKEPTRIGKFVKGVIPLYFSWSRHVAKHGVD